MAIYGAICLVDVVDVVDAVISQTPQLYYNSAYDGAFAEICKHLKSANTE